MPALPNSKLRRRLHVSLSCAAILAFIFGSLGFVGGVALLVSDGALVTPALADVAAQPRHSKNNPDRRAEEVIQMKTLVRSQSTAVVTVRTSALVLEDLALTAFGDMDAAR